MAGCKGVGIGTFLAKVIIPTPVLQVGQDFHSSKFPVSCQQDHGPTGKKSPYIGQLSETGVSTYNASLGLFASVVQKLTGADILVLAVQPRFNSFGAGISEQVRRTLDWLEQALEEILS